MSRRICVVTGTRAEYGLLRPLMAEIRASGTLALQLVVTGAHLSSEHGSTWREIEADGFSIDARVDMQLKDDTSASICQSMGRALAGFGEVFTQLDPDVVVGLGDRYELLAAVTAASVCRRVIAHIHGGERTEGAFDDAFRHAVTKLSHLHFTSTETYRRRVIQLGESPHRVFNVGALGVDNIRTLPLLERSALEDALGLSLRAPLLLVTFHPVTLAPGQAEAQCGALLDALDQIPDACLVFTGVNADPEGRVVQALIERFVARHSDRARMFASLGALRYLSLMKHADAVVGNSSSGIIEAPALRVATVDIGDRQRGRVKAQSVIASPPEATAIAAAVREALTPAFRARVAAASNPYGDGHAAARIRAVLEAQPAVGLDKTFHDLPN